MKPLDGIRVLDLSRVLSGPHAGRLLADLGADVIKLEPPEGDLTRHAHPRRNGISLYFTQQNCGKRNVSVDLRAPEGTRIGLELAAACDVVLENYRPGVLDRLGCGYAAVRERNPRVVWCSITGWGSGGPESGRRAYAPVVHAEAGFMDLAARERGTEPVSEAVSHGDVYTGVHACNAILAALLRRERAGTGDRVEVSMAEVLLFANEWSASDMAGGDGGRPQAFGGAKAPVVRLADGTYACVPGDPVITFPAFARSMGRQDLLDDERFSDPPARQRHRAELAALIADWASGIDDFEAFEAALEPNRLAAGIVRSAAEASRLPWAQARGSVAAVDDRGGGTVELVRVPLVFDDADAGPSGVAAHQGEHNADVLTELLGIDTDDIDRLTHAGVLVRKLPA